MKLRQILVAAATSLVVATPVFAASGSYGEGTMWADLKVDVAESSGKSSAPASTRIVAAASEVSIYEQLAAFQRELRNDDAQGVAGPTGPSMATAERRVPSNELRTDATIYEQVIAAQRDMGRF